MTIKSSKVILSYNKCPLKSYKYLKGEKGSISEYEKLLQQDKENLTNTFISNQNIQVKSFEKFDKPTKGDIFYKDVLLTIKDSKVLIDLLKKEGKYLIPIIFNSNDKLSKENRLEINWIKYVLEECNYKIKEVQVVSNTRTTKIKKFDDKEIKKTLFHLNNFDIEAPRLILNKNCVTCEFQEKCTTEAKQKDDLSLLDRISKKQILQLEKKGIFTVKQLSYTYKPRKRSKKLRENYLYKPELQALAIREEKVFIQKKPEVTEEKTELFFDIEGINEINEFYLFGALILHNEQINYEYFYCKEKEDEKLDSVYS